VETWKFLTAHARALLCSAHAIVADLTAAGYVVKHKLGRRNRYQIQAHLPLPEPATRAPAIGDVLTLLVGDAAGREPRQSPPGPQHAATSGTDHKQSPRTSPKAGRPCLMPEEPGAPATSGQRQLQGPAGPRAATTADSTRTSDAAGTARATPPL
jgi:hypothetical protein